MNPIIIGEEKMAKVNVNKAALPTLEPLDPLGQRFLKYFNHGWGFIYAPTPKSGDRPLWQTETRYPLQPRNLWQQYLNNSVLLGLRFGKQTNYLLLDIDSSSKLHPTNSRIKYQQVLACLEDIGLCRPIPIQSSERGGLHVYYFLEEKQHSYTLACAVQQTLEAAGFKIRGGQLEIFPNSKVYSQGRPSNFNAHRLPLQPGSYLLDDCLEAYSDDIEDFLDAADWSASGQDYSALAVALTQASSKKIVKFPYHQRNAAEQWQHDLSERISEGWTGHGQTNELLKDIACYGIVFRQLSGSTLVDYIVLTASQSPGYVDWCRHQHEIEQRAREWARCCEGFYTPYASIPNRANSYKEQFGVFDENKVIDLHPNFKRQQETLERIRSIVAQLQQTETFPERTSDRANAIIAASKAQYGKGVSQTTLHKPIYLPLWHPDHQYAWDRKFAHEGKLLSSGAEEQQERRGGGAEGKDVNHGSPLPPCPPAPDLPQRRDVLAERYCPDHQEQQQSKQRVNALPESMRAILTAEKYPQLPDPWREEQEAETLASQGKEEQTAEIYTPPPYMKVLYTNELRVLPPATPKPPLNQLQKSLPNSNSSNPDSDSNSSNPNFNSSKIFTVTTDKQNQYPLFPSGPFVDNKQCLSNAQNLTTPEISDVIHKVDSAIDSNFGINSDSEYSSETEPSLAPSTPVSTQEDVGHEDSSSLPLTQPDNVAEKQTFSCEDYRLAIRLKLQASTQARHWVKVYCTTEKLSLLPQERIKLQQLVQRLLMLESPSLILRQEAQQWLAANPSALEMQERLKARNYFNGEGILDHRGFGVET
jgi:hypothetical protein